VFVDELVCMLNLRSFCLALLFVVLGGVGGFFELTNDDSGDCLLVVVVGQGLFLSIKVEAVLGCWFLVVGGGFGFRWRV
jgi:hypothetical protein